MPPYIEGNEYLESMFNILTRQLQVVVSPTTEEEPIQSHPPSCEQLFHFSKRKKQGFKKLTKALSQIGHRPRDQSSTWSGGGGRSLFLR